MPDIPRCESCGNNQACKLKDEDFIDLCPKLLELPADSHKNQIDSPFEEQQLGLKITDEGQKGTNKKRKKRQEQKIPDDQQSNLNKSDESKIVQKVNNKRRGLPKQRILKDIGK